MKGYYCEYPGRYKVVHRTGYVSSLLCSGHADDWMRQLGGRRVEPRNVTGEELPCKGDWMLPGMVPG